MKLENQVCTLEQSRQLKELGVSIQPATFYWYELYVNRVRSMVLWPYLQEDFAELKPNDSLTSALTEDTNNEVCAAFTVAELGVMLPRDYPRPTPLHSGEYGTRWPAVISRRFDTEAVARADFLIFLLKSGKTTSEEVNARLAAA